MDRPDNLRQRIDLMLMLMSLALRFFVCVVSGGFLHAPCHQSWLSLVDLFDVYCSVIKSGNIQFQFSHSMYLLCPMYFTMTQINFICDLPKFKTKWAVWSLNIQTERQYLGNNKHLSGTCSSIVRQLKNWVCSNKRLFNISRCKYQEIKAEIFHSRLMKMFYTKMSKE